MTLPMLSSILAACAAACTVAASSTVCFAKTVELRNDVLQDNGDAAAVCGFAVGEKFAARFTPPAYPARILKVRVLLSAVGLGTGQCTAADIDNAIEMPLEVFHSASSIPGDSLGAFSGVAYSNDAVLNELDVNAANLSIDDGSFLIAYTLQQTDASPVHDASSAAVKDANYIYGDLGQGSQWYSFSDLAASSNDPKGNWVIRVDVSVPDDEPDAGTGGAAGAAGAGGSGGGTDAGDSAGAAGTSGGAAGEGGQPAAAQGASSSDDGGCSTAGAGAASRHGWAALAVALAVASTRLRRRGAGKRQDDQLRARA